MTFFVTSAGPGKGGDLGGLAGADAHCAKLAQAAGSTGKTWHAYLSTQGPNAVNARDRIGKGPWQNAKGVFVAKSVDDLHSDSNNVTKQTNLTEKGEVIHGRGDMRTSPEETRWADRSTNRRVGTSPHRASQTITAHSREKY